MTTPMTLEDMEALVERAELHWWDLRLCETCHRFYGTDVKDTEPRCACPRCPECGDIVEDDQRVEDSMKCLACSGYTTRG